MSISIDRKYVIQMTSNCNYDHVINLYFLHNILMIVIQSKMVDRISNIYLLEYSIRDVYKDIIFQGVDENDVKVCSPVVSIISSVH